MLRVQPEALVITPFTSITQTPFRSSVMPGTVAVNTVAVLVLSTCPKGIEAALSAVPPATAAPAYLSSRSVSGMPVAGLSYLAPQAALSALVTWIVPSPVWMFRSLRRSSTSSIRSAFSVPVKCAVEF